MRLPPPHAVSLCRAARPRGRMFVTQLCAAAAFAFLAACSHGQNDEQDPFPHRMTVPIRVVNQNYLDVDVAAIVDGVSRRVGDVPGNTSRNFSITLSAASGQPIVMTARPIGGNGSFTSGSLNVGMGETIELRIGTTLRQSMAVLVDSL